VLEEFFSCGNCLEAPIRQQSGLVGLEFKKTSFSTANMVCHLVNFKLLGTLEDTVALDGIFALNDFVALEDTVARHPAMAPKYI